MTKWLVMSLISLGFAVPAFAEKPCEQDMATFCGTVEPGEGRVMKCMKENESKLSPACKSHIEKMKKEMKHVKEACHDDYEKFCSEEKPGKGRVMKCMKEHKDEMSQACKDEMNKMKHKKGKKGA
ncbi:cysteine rich repeat-containing protein [Bdellovibrio svalbardensis]|uniref:Cysteine rich repeat-containing protein n=1 Tax=Bdellovibrio svalbardensis TaxID=2972972 RepID=A0ABT6DN27_9BACT|nr:cysteine rich repeat-containing protein [Bdellovibrio svalbardensis]MDG0817324.1 cysteine rich repeat-containing protein [Bdellovibrio svalbardensis]